MLIVDLTHLACHKMDALLRLWLAYSVDPAASRERHRWKAEIMFFPVVYHVPTLGLDLIIGRLVKEIN